MICIKSSNFIKEEHELVIKIPFFFNFERHLLLILEYAVLARLIESLCLQKAGGSKIIISNVSVKLFK